MATGQRGQPLKLKTLHRHMLAAKAIFNTGFKNGWITTNKNMVMGSAFDSFEIAVSEKASAMMFDLEEGWQDQADDLQVARQTVDAALWRRAQENVSKLALAFTVCDLELAYGHSEKSLEIARSKGDVLLDEDMVPIVRESDIDKLEVSAESVALARDIVEYCTGWKIAKIKNNMSSGKFHDVKRYLVATLA